MFSHFITAFLIYTYVTRSIYVIKYEFLFFLLILKVVFTNNIVVYCENLCKLLIYTWRNAESCVRRPASRSPAVLNRQYRTQAIAVMLGRVE